MMHDISISKLYPHSKLTYRVFIKYRIFQRFENIFWTLVPPVSMCVLSLKPRMDR